MKTLSARLPLVRGIGIALSLTLTATGAFAVLTTRRATSVSVDDAVLRFRGAETAPDAGGPASPLPSAEPAAGGAAPGQPMGKTSGQSGVTNAGPARYEVREGVYVYDTRGYEETDALTGSRHDYPSQTGVSVWKTDCGMRSRWQPLNERWDEAEFCLNERGTSFRKFTTYHEFFSKGDTQSFDCPESAYVFMYSGRAGDSWKFDCTGQGAEITSSVSVIGPEQVTVSGKPMEAIRYRYELSLRGRNRGTQIQERWIAVDSGFLLKITQHADMETDSPFGTVKYFEQYTTTLHSTEPRK